MAQVVGLGSIMKCSFGVAPCIFQPMNNQTVIAKVPIGNIIDTSMASIPTFGLCQSMANPTVASATAAALGVLTPMPCTPVISGPWVCNSHVMIKGSPILTTDAKAFCAYCGVIQFTNSTVNNVTVK